MLEQGSNSVLSPGEPGLGATKSGRREIPPKLYRISEIVEYTGVSRQTIHNYTTMGLITEARRTGGGHRLYDEGVFTRLDTIEEMKRQGGSLRAVRFRLEEMDGEKNRKIS